MLEELKGLPMIKAHRVLIDFELTDENISNYRSTFDCETVLISYFGDDDDPESYVIIGGDLCDILYSMRDEMEDRGAEEYCIFYYDKYETKNFDGNVIDLLGAAVEAYASPSDRNANDMEKTVVCFEDEICFVMEDNYYQDEIDTEDFDELWNE